MTRIPVVGAVCAILLLVSSLACRDGNDRDVISESVVSGPPTYLTITGPAKRFCSAIWVSEQVREEAVPADD